jgi:hypothetical protein
VETVVASDRPTWPETEADAKLPPDPDPLDNVDGVTHFGTVLQGLTLIRGTPVKVPQGIPVVFLNEVLGRLADEIGKEEGTNFFAIGAFERKDRLAAAVSTWVMTLPAGTFIFAPRFQAGEFAYAVDVVAMNCRVAMEVTS